MEKDTTAEKVAERKETSRLPDFYSGGGEKGLQPPLPPVGGIFRLPGEAVDVVVVVFIKGVFVGLEEGGEFCEAFLVEIGKEFVAFRLLTLP